MQGFRLLGLISPLKALLDKALWRSLNYAIRNQAGALTL